MLVDQSTLDDAGVFAFGRGTALVQTVDFFPPVVDDPYDFGRIAAANAVSDVYAMGGRPLTALNIVCFRFNPGGPAGAADLEALNRLNQDILVELQESGVAAPSYTTLQGAYCLRVAISNHRSRFEDFDLLVSEVLRIGQALNPKTAT